MPGRPGTRSAAGPQPVRSRSAADPQNPVDAAVRPCEPDRMPSREESRATNRLLWDGRAAAHAASPEYAVARFAEEPDFLSDVVRFDRPLLGDVAGLRGVHLQCHIGTDTVSLSRLGARMTGLDFSAESLVHARRIARLAGADVEFVESDVLDAATALPAGAFDLVFTGIGALCWVPDIRRWAEVVRTLLRPGGRLFLREGHPVLWALDEKQADRLVIGYPYFSTEEALVWDEDGTYVTTDERLEHTASHSWNHGLGEIITALLDQDLRLTGLTEHRSVPWDALPGQLARGTDGEWRLREGADRLPLSYTLQAVHG